VTIHLLVLILLAQGALVAGQVFLKHGMNLTRSPVGGAARIVGILLAGIGLLTLWFLLWMGLLQKLDLSYVYPFEGLSPVLLVLAACAILKESLGWKSWTGVGLITLGTIVVGLS